jgi:clathrin heavy chain
MVTAAVSASTDIAEELLSYFVDIGNKECFAALLYVCFDLLRSDVVEELSWQHGLNDFYMPYKIQVQRSLVDKVSSSEISLFSILISCTVGTAGEGGSGTIQEGRTKGAN